MLTSTTLDIVLIFALVGSDWAEPSVEHLRQLLRHLYDNQEEATAKGFAARQSMLQRFSPKMTAQRLHREFKRIEEDMDLGTKIR